MESTGIESIDVCQMVCVVRILIEVFKIRLILEDLHAVDFSAIICRIAFRIVCHVDDIQ